MIRNCFYLIPPQKSSENSHEILSGCALLLALALERKEGMWDGLNDKQGDEPPACDSKSEKRRLSAFLRTQHR